MRNKIFDVIEIAGPGNRLSAVYDYLMMVVIVVSMVPLAFKDTNVWFQLIDTITVSVFVIDYILRFVTADIKLNRGPSSFLVYPFTPMALIDLLAIIPSFIPVLPGLRLVKIFRLFRTFRVFRSLKIFRYAKSAQIVADVIRQQKGPLLAVCSMALGYVVISALVIFNVEPDTFSDFFEAIYWATVSLTTMGYGDIYPVTTIGRIVTMISSFVGIAIVALPAGIITAGYMERIQEEKEGG